MKLADEIAFRVAWWVPRKVVYWCAGGWYVLYKFGKWLGGRALRAADEGDAMISVARDIAEDAVVFHRRPDNISVEEIETYVQHVEIRIDAALAAERNRRTGLDLLAGTFVGLGFALLWFGFVRFFQWLG